MAKLDSMESLLLHELRDLYSAERQMAASLKKLIRAASSPKLKKAFETHLDQTQKQQERLEKVFEKLDQKPGRQKCKAMEGLVEEAAEIIKEEAEPSVKDAALIASAQRAEHYEISGYGTARSMAQLLGMDDVAQLLQRTLDEEGQTDELLNKLAMSEINVEAVSHA